MTTEDVFEKLKEWFPSNILSIKGPDIGVNGESWIEVDPIAIIEIIKYLKEEREFLFDYLACETAIDLGENIAIVYILFSYSLRQKLIIKTLVPADRPVVQTVEDIWGAANWYEREIFDLFGVLFHGHSNLRRIMLPEDWVGHPLRKSYREPIEFRRISHKRVSSIKEP